MDEAHECSGYAIQLLPQLRLPNKNLSKEETEISIERDYSAELRLLRRPC